MVATKALSRRTFPIGSFLSDSRRSRAALMKCFTDNAAEIMPVRENAGTRHWCLFSRFDRLKAAKGLLLDRDGLFSLNVAGQIRVSMANSPSQRAFLDLAHHAGCNNSATGHLAPYGR